MRNLSDEDFEDVCTRSFCIPSRSPKMRQPRTVLPWRHNVARSYKHCNTLLERNWNGGIAKILACTLKGSLLLNLIVSKCAIRCIRRLRWCQRIQTHGHRGSVSDVNMVLPRVCHAWLGLNLSIVFGLPMSLFWPCQEKVSSVLAREACWRSPDLVSNLSSKRSALVADRFCTPGLLVFNLGVVYDLRWGNQL
jgi:hypothetical protein